MRLGEYNQRYETILHGNFSSEDKSKMMASLMTEMEQEFNIPIIKNDEWGSENKAIIALYRKVSMSREL